MAASTEAGPPPAAAPPATAPPPDEALAAAAPPAAAPPLAAAPPPAFDLSPVRAYRGQVLAATPEGRTIIEVYREHGPSVAAGLANDPALRARAVELVCGWHADLVEHRQLGPQSTRELLAFANELAGADPALQKIHAKLAAAMDKFAPRSGG